MVKGFIFFRTGKIPFVIENYRMDLFTDDSLLEIFCKEYNFKENYILQGLCFDIGPHGRKATFLVENSMGSTCYLRCYIVYTFNKDETYDLHRYSVARLLMQFLDTNINTLKWCDLESTWL